MNKRNYPITLFISSMVLNLIKYWYLLAISVLLFLVRFFSPALPAIIPTSIMLFWILIAFITQLKMRKTALEAEHEVFDRIFGSNNPRGWRENAIDVTNEKTDNFH